MSLEETEEHAESPVISAATGDADQKGVPAAITDAGCERELNEDRYAVIECRSGLAWLVADGMGGVTGGELAAQLALDSIKRELEQLPARAPADALRSALLEANRVVVLRRQNQAFAQMGTTIVATLFAAPEVVVAHVGDSRAYLIREGAIQQLTIDHTFVQQLVEKGQIKIEEALAHPQAHILTRCIGAEPGLNIDMKRYWIWPLAAGEPEDVLLLCTDGLYSQVTEQEMAEAITRETPHRACVSLVEMAKERGGYDNITLAVIPLGGRLQTQPPSGFDSEKQLHKRQAKEARKAAPPLPTARLLRDLGFMSALIILAVLVSALLFISLYAK